MSKLDGIKIGDRVRVTIEGFVGRTAGFDLTVIADRSAGEPSCFNHDEVAADTFQITRIEPAFKLGDEVLVLVLGRHRNSNETVVGFLKDGRAIVEYQAGDTSNVCAYDVSCLSHA